MPKDGIQMFCNCRRCYSELPKNESMSSYARINVGLVNEQILRIWCVRHDALVVDINLDPPMIMPSCESIMHKS